MYEIQSKSDFQSGATLIVRIQEEDLDKKALYTILEDRPDFVLPFHYKQIDGQIEFTYQVNERSKLTYLTGSCSPREYSELWINILQPLLNCDDWFMTPYSFVLKPEYIYCHKDNKTVSFVYIPSVKAFADDDMLKGMLMKVAKEKQSTDKEIENKVLWAIQESNLNEVLNIIKAYELSNIQENTPKRTPSATLAETIKHYGADEKDEAQKSSLGIAQKFAERNNADKPNVSPDYKPNVSPDDKQKTPFSDRPKTASGFSADYEGFEIDFLYGSKKDKEKEQKSKLFDLNKSPKKKENKPIKEETKADKDVKAKGGFWKKKSKEPAEIIKGAAELPAIPDFRHEFPKADPLPPMDMDGGVTQLDDDEFNGVGFRYIGNGMHPKTIEVNAPVGSVFTIGRFDVSAGAKQSSFEFDMKTKAVSRRHAAIERSEDGYRIVDVVSTAGTFVNGQSIPPNMPLKLEKGFRVSFGNLGADYVWEE